MAKAFAAVSGGVDSSLTAYLLKQAGYDVTAVHLELSGGPEGAAEADHSDLEKTCRLLDIPLIYLDIRKQFQERIIAPFCREYSLGRTPNPCIRCNRQIKFGLLLEKVLEMGGDYLATGHYARIEKELTGYRLLKGSDPAKDQSYFLYTLGQKALAHVLFPVGGLLKSEVKKRAAELGLPSARKPESQDICFIPDNDSRAFLSTHLTLEPGDIVDTEGRLLGRHKGLALYTVGQRQGMNVSASRRLYVVRLDSAGNRLVIGDESQLYQNKLTASELSWTSGEVPQGITEVEARVRYRSAGAKASLEIKDSRAEVVFTEEQRAIAPGQSVVFYQDNRVLGGGTIAQAP